MNEELRATLEAVRSGTLSVDEAALRLKKAPFEDLGYAKVDLHRAVRQGAAEVIYGAGKTPAQIAGIAARMMPVPRTLSSSCGTCVRCQEEYLPPDGHEEIEQIVEEADGKMLYQAENR